MIFSYLTYPEESNGNQSLYSTHRQNISFIEDQSNEHQKKSSTCPKRHYRHGFSLYLGASETHKCSLWTLWPKLDIFNEINSCEVSAV